MAKITKIKAGDPPADKEPKKPTPARKAPEEPKKGQKTQKVQKEAPQKPTFVLFRPFIALGCYIRDSWHEIRQVRWPSRKSTWQMFFAVLIYALFFVLVITLLDILFSWLFNLILGK